MQHFGIIVGTLVDWQFYFLDISFLRFFVDTAAHSVCCSCLFPPILCAGCSASCFLVGAATFRFHVVPSDDIGVRFCTAGVHAYSSTLQMIPHGLFYKFQCLGFSFSLLSILN